MAERATDVESMAEDQVLAKMEIQDRLVPFVMASTRTSRLALRTWHDRTKVSRPSQEVSVIGAAVE